jgi:hypothetical protein
MALMIFSISQTQAAWWPKNMIIGTGRLGSPSSVLGIGMAQMITKYVPGVKATASPASPQEMVHLLDKKELGMAFSADKYNYDAPRGLGDFKGRPVSSVRMLINSDIASCLHIFTLFDSGIKSCNDLRGKKVAGRQEGNSPLDENRKAVLKAYGLEDKDIRLLTYGDYFEVARLVKEGVVDVGLAQSGSGLPAFVDMATFKKVRWIALDMEKMPAIEPATKPYARFYMEAGTYPGQDEKVLTVAAGVSWNVHKEMDEEMVYQILRAIYGHEEEFNAIHPEAQKTYSLKTALRAWFMPYHSGAVKYYKERGVWTKEHDEKQAAVLKELGLKQ